MLGAGPLVAVGEEHHDPRVASPLRFRGAQELVDHHLGAVHEVAELGLPDDEPLRLRRAVAVLEPEDRLLREERIDDLDRRLVVGEMGEGLPGAAGLLVVHGGVAVGERPALAVLTRHPYRVAVPEEGPVGQHLGEAPVDGAFAPRHLAPRRHQAVHHPVQAEVRGLLAELEPDLLHRLDGDAGPGLRPPVRPEVGLPVREMVDLEPVPERPRHRLARLQPIEVGVVHALRLAFGDDSLALEPLRVEAVDPRLPADLRVHQGLGDHRLVGLVVAVAPVAHEVDHHVAAELHPVVEGEAGDERDRLRVVPVHVEDRRLHELRDIGAEAARARVEGIAVGEADEVVDDDVDRPAGRVAPRLRQVEGLGDHPLARERGVAVDEDRQDLVARGVPAPHLPRPHRALHHRVDDLEVRRVEREHDVGRPALGLDVRGEAEVVLDVARPRALLDLSLELLEQDRGELSEDVDEHVEAAAVSHADDDLAGRPRARPLDDLVEQRDEALAPLEREPLLPRVAGVQELLEPARRDDPPEELTLLLGGERGPPACPLQALLHPPFRPGAGEVGQLGADVGAVAGVEDVHELAQGELRRAEQRVGGELPIEVRLREPVHLRVDVGGAGAAVDLVHVEGVDVRDAEPAVAVGADEAVDGSAAVVRGGGGVRRGRRSGIGTGAGFAAAAVELGEE